MKKAVQVPFAAMEEHSRPEDGYTNPECNQPVVPNEADILTALDNLRYLEEKDSLENASIVNFDGSAGAREAIPSLRNRCDNICSLVHSQVHQLSPSVDDSRFFNTLNTPRNVSDPYGMAGNTSDSAHYWNNSASNYVFHNETYPDNTKYKHAIRGKFADDLSTDSKKINCDEILQLNASSMITFKNRAVDGIEGQRIESHYDLSQIAQNNSEPCRIPEVVESASSYYSVQNFAAPKSSGCHRNENTPPVVGMMVHSSNIGDNIIKYEEIKALVCNICEDDFAAHESEKNGITRVDSLYYNLERTKLQIHRSTRIPKTTCTICGKEHAVENSHKIEHRCPRPGCKKIFPCRTRFYQHIPGHGKYFKRHCWVCGRKFSEHNTDNDSIYKCCVCGVKPNKLSTLKTHSRLHLPRCFCNLCKDEYRVEDESLHSNEIKCCFCRNIFKCRNQLEKHFQGHVKHFLEVCRVNKSNEESPFFLWTFQGYFQLYTEFEFKNLLYSLACLEVFKCEQCGRRFPHKDGLNSHSRYCKALPYKCEICETRFHTIDLLLSHGFVKHAG